MGILFPSHPVISFSPTFALKSLKSLIQETRKLTLPSEPGFALGAFIHMLSDLMLAASLWRYLYCSFRFCTLRFALCPPQWPLPFVPGGWPRWSVSCRPPELVEYSRFLLRKFPSAESVLCPPGALSTHLECRYHYLIIIRDSRAGSHILVFMLRLVIFLVWYSTFLSWVGSLQK